MVGTDFLEGKSFYSRVSGGQQWFLITHKGGHQYEGT